MHSKNNLYINLFLLYYVNTICYRYYHLISLSSIFLLFNNSILYIHIFQPFPHPQARQPVKTQPKSGGAMSIIMPIYTVGIIVFFLYTVLKVINFAFSTDILKLFYSMHSNLKII